jgi:hypothetical protein
MHTILTRARERQRAVWAVKALVPDKWRVSHYSVEPGNFIGNDGEKIPVDQLTVRDAPSYQTKDVSVNVDAPYIRVTVSILV